MRKELNSRGISLNTGKAVLIYCVVAIALIIAWGRGIIVALVDLFFIGLFVVVSYYGLKKWRETRKLSPTLIVGLFGIALSVSLLFLAPSWLFPRID